MEDLSLKFDDNEELNALTLTTLLNSGVEEALSNLSPAQLIQLEKNVQKLKRQKSPMTTSFPGLAKVTPASGKKRRLSESDDISDAHVERPRPTGGQYMNLPASTPQVEFRDGIEWLIFTYSTKGHIQEYHIRADIDDIASDEIPDDFKAENCVYPRALVPKEAYIGNRWEYETSVNEIAWKLCWRNPGVLGNKRGLIQRAVDSYRNRTPENRSRRVMRQEKIHQNSPYAKRADGLNAAPLIRVPGPKTLTLQYTDSDGELVKVKIRVDIEMADLSSVQDEWRITNAIYPQALNGGPDYTTERWEYETACNELAWKLAALNPTKLPGKRMLLQKAVEAYQSRVEAAEKARQAVLFHHQQALGQSGYDASLIYGATYPGAIHGLGAAAAIAGHHHFQHHDDDLDEKSEDFSHIAAHALQQALAQGVEPQDLDAVSSGHYEHNVGFHHHLPFTHSIVDDHQFHHHHHIHHQGGEEIEVEGDEDFQNSKVGGEEEDNPQTVSTAELLGNL